MDAKCGWVLLYQVVTETDSSYFIISDKNGMIFSLRVASATFS